MITLGTYAFSGPFLAPLWSPARQAGLYAVLVPGWRLLTFRALHFGQADALSIESVRAHPRYAEWLRIAGTEWNLYVATHEMSFSSESQREAAAAALARDYRPQFIHPAGMREEASLKDMLLARAMRTNQD